MYNNAQIIKQGYFLLLDNLLEEIYKPCDCPTCQSAILQLSADEKTPFKQILKTGKKAFKKLHQNGKYHPRDLDKVDEYQQLIRETSDVLEFPITQNIPKELQQYLKKDGFIFSGLRAHAQLTQARQYLMDSQGTPVPYHLFEQKILKLNKTYNRNYLQAEYLFAQQSAQSAANWQNLQDDTDRYLLQYRTAEDDRVRDAHRLLNETTLPKNDPFWQKYYPPNGWRCRCLAVEVLARDYPTSDSKDALEKGSAATTQIARNGQNKLSIFRFNPGMDKVLFPPKHPYNKVVGADVAKPIVEKIFAKSNKLTGKQSKYTPKTLDEYEDFTGVKIDRSFFGLLKNEVPLKFSQNNKNKHFQAFYNPTDKAVSIINTTKQDRITQSKWFSKALVHHEYGHAIDWQLDLRKNPKVTALIKTYRKEFSKNGNQKYQAYHDKLMELENYAQKKGHHTLLEKTIGALDTLASLSKLTPAKPFGYGHKPAYFKHKGLSEAEFIAHMFENKWVNNEVFKKVMPELYKDTIKLYNDLFNPIN